jgi:hypothetical protein
MIHSEDKKDILFKDYKSFRRLAVIDIANNRNSLASDLYTLLKDGISSGYFEKNCTQDKFSNIWSFRFYINTYIGKVHFFNIHIHRNYDDIWINSISITNHFESFIRQSLKEYGKENLMNLYKSSIVRDYLKYEHGVTYGNAISFDGEMPYMDKEYKLKK